jgi:hypothetical protein
VQAVQAVQAVRRAGRTRFQSPACIINTPDPPELPTLRFCWTVRREVFSALGITHGTVYTTYCRHLDSEGGVGPLTPAARRQAVSMYRQSTAHAGYVMSLGENRKCPYHEQRALAGACSLTARLICGLPTVPQKGTYLSVPHPPDPVA